LSILQHLSGGSPTYLELEIFIGELFAVDGLSSSTITLGEVATLDHELLNNTVEGRTLVTIALLAGRQSAVGTTHQECDACDNGGFLPEIFDGLGNGLAIKPDDNATESLVAMLDIEVHLKEEGISIGARRASLEALAL
jgi:hypothetical protein